jgi:hypothetical protein
VLGCALTNQQEREMRLVGATFVLLLLIASRVVAADLTGNWSIDGDVQGNAVNLACVVQESADAKISGKCQVNGIETEIQGTAKDATFRFWFTVQGYELTYNGTLEGDSIKGSIEVAGATGSFNGKRK